MRNPFSVDRLLSTPLAFRLSLYFINSWRYKALRKRVAKLGQGQPWLIFGKGETCSKSCSPETSQNHVVVRVNGASPTLVGRAEATILLLTSFFLSVSSSKARETRKLIGHTRADTVVFIGNPIAAMLGAAALKVLDVQFSFFIRLGRIERAAIIREVVTEDLGLGAAHERVSSGIFAVILACWAGASEVAFRGLSFSDKHADADSLALNLLAKYSRL